ncbi:MAG: DinB family protein [Candidatus Limnocylindrales bacterium]
MVTHPLVLQLRFTRSEFVRALAGVTDDDARRRVEPMNCIGWNVGHLAWQEQQYFLNLAQRQMPMRDIDRDFASGRPASTPALSDVLAAWEAITTTADPWLDAVTSDTLLQHFTRADGRPGKRTYGSLLHRVIYHYWFHLGENLAIRQLLGHERLPQFVGDIDEKAPYVAEITDD